MRVRQAVTVEGRVQGVGFRPFVYRLAAELNLTGWVRNDADGVHLETEGDAQAVSEFLERLKSGPGDVRAVNSSLSACLSEGAFRIVPSRETSFRIALPPPDSAPCSDCLADMRDASGRRYRYPFISCASCGPRFSILYDIPFDRASTAMRDFPLCGVCLREYEDPGDRRFHAETISCPACGPRLVFYDASGRPTCESESALSAALEIVSRGGILALKGVGGFQLMADARSSPAVEELRRRKHRPEKPFAVMFRSLEDVRTRLAISAMEERALASPEAPVVLLRGSARGLAPSVSPGLSSSGAFLPSSGLHHLLLGAWGFPVVATSGNAADEPICTDTGEALARLSGVADGFLTHNRAIVRPLDDSVVHVAAGAVRVLRSARGYAPALIQAGTGVPAKISALGGHQKSAVALSSGQVAALGPHVGDLDHPLSRAAWKRSIDDLASLLGVRGGARAAADLHPDYASGAVDVDGPCERVQHHHAHIASVLAETGGSGPVLGVAWDGAGAGTDGTVWGGEFLRADLETCERVAHLRTFPLPGGDACAREPRRACLGVLWEMMGPDAFAADEKLWNVFSPDERSLLSRLIERGSPVRTSSAGRLFDAAAFLLGAPPCVSYEGHAAALLESWADEKELLPYETAILRGSGPLILDWEPMFAALLKDKAAGAARGTMAARFHNGLASAITRLAVELGASHVALSGGCFQNRFLCERSSERLTKAGVRASLNRLFPANDGGLAAGQLAVAAARLRRKEH